MICTHFVPSLAKIGLYEISFLRNTDRGFWVSITVDFCASSSLYIHD